MAAKQTPTRRRAPAKKKTTEKAKATPPRKAEEKTAPGTDVEAVASDESLTFVDALPTPRRGRESKWDRILAPLRENPGQWARLPGHHNSGVASMIRAGKTKGTKPEEFEVATRTLVDDLPEPPKGQTYIYARYVGESDGDSAPEPGSDEEWEKSAK